MKKFESLEYKIFHARQSVAKCNPDAITQYAIVLNQVFQFDWFCLTGTDRSANGKLISEEKTAFFEAFRQLNYDYTINPESIWARIRAAAQSQRCNNHDLAKPPKES